MIISAQNKNVLVTLSTVGWGMFFVYMLISERINLEASTGKNIIILFAAPFVFFGLGYHHWTKQKGEKSLSALALGLGVIGIMATWVGVDVATDKASSLKLPDILLILFGLIHLVLAYWSYQNAEDKNKTSSDLELREVLILYKEISAGKLSNFQNEKYGSLVSDAALQAVKENQLNVIANGINLSVKLEEKLGDHKVILGLIMDKLSEAYVELDVESKYELFPLFINKIDGAPSHYFHDTDIQKWALNSYEVLLKKDNLTFERMEKEYFNDTPLAKEYPYIFGMLQEHIEQQK